MKKTISILLVTLITVSCLGLMKNDVSRQQRQYEFMWETCYESFTDMIEDADLVIQGTVTDQEYLVDGVVFTLNRIDVDVVYSGISDGEIIVAQFGGTFGNTQTPYPEELPKLRQGQPYLLFLKAQAGKYYIMGAGQGYFEVSNQRRSINGIYCYEEEFNNRLEAYQAPMRYPTPTNGHAYPSSSCSVSYYISGSMTSSQKNKLRDGIESWNGYSDLYLYETTSGAYADITFTTSSSSLNAGIAGYTEFISTRKRTVTIYTENFTTSNLTNWQKLGAHETGHCVGLAHNDSSVSVMASSLSTAESTPQYYDIVTIQELYP